MKFFLVQFIICAMACQQVYATPLPIIAQFFGIWTESGQTWQQKFRPDTPFDQLNRLYVPFAKIVIVNGHYTIDFDGPLEHVQDIQTAMKLLNPHAEIFLTIGGTGDPTSFSGAANDPLFAENVKNFLLQYGFQGADIDWEENYETNLNLLLTNLSAVLRSNGLMLTLDVWPNIAGYDLPVIENLVDQINVMTYGSGVDVCVVASQFINAGFPANKILGGIDTETGVGVDTLGSDGSITKKVNCAFSLGLAGMMEWRMDNDYASQQNLNYPTYQGALQLWAEMS